ncbi:MAG: extracellular solute-binding protein [Limnochordia bacterium]|jgi:multiple sugar transport system substrate-binding protein
MRRHWSNGGRVVLSGILLLLVLALPSAAKVSIVYMGRGNVVEKEVYDELLLSFMKAHPDIKVDMQWVAGNAPVIYERLLVTTAAGTAPDAFWMHTWSMGDLLSTHMLYPLDSFLAKEGGLTRDYYAASMDEFSRNGQVLGLPRESSTLVLYHNVDSFLEGGVDLPHDDWTWDDLLAAARKLTRPSETKPVYGVSAPTTHDRNISIIWQNGGRFLNEERTEATLSKPESVEAVRWIWQLMHEWRVAAPPTVPQPSMAKGQLAMGYGIRSQVRAYNDAQVNWGATLVPSGRARYNRIASSAHGVHAQSQHPEAAFQLVKYLSGPTGIRALAAGGLTVPPLRSVAREVFTESRDHVFFKAMEYARAEPVTPRYFDIIDIKNKAFNGVWRNTSPIESTLQELDRHITAVLRWE